ncbi:MAG: hypothetical protein ACAH59_01775 [Pseudobdellovibrionaceae bacterium]
MSENAVNKQKEPSGPVSKTPSQKPKPQQDQEPTIIEGGSSED